MKEREIFSFDIRAAISIDEIQGKEAMITESRFSFRKTPVMPEWFAGA